ncbi:MAG: bifunctional YncE family protein/alkaline phosphatase family protein [bacterium]|nr:bifunctional YncE family protein/alkaline phosphatase family protein [bacterium]
MIIGSIGCAGVRQTATARPAGLKAALERDAGDLFVKAVVGPQDDGTWIVPTTQIIDPAGQSLIFGGRPVGLALSPDGAVLAVKNRTDLVFIDPRTRAIVQTLALPKGQGASFCGIAWAPDGATVWTTSAAGALCGARRGADGQFAWAAKIALPGPDVKGDSAPGGLVFDEKDPNLVWVTLSRNNALGLVDLAAEKVLVEIPVGIAPYDVRLNGDHAWVANWGGRRPRSGDLTGPSSGSEVVVDRAGIAASGTVSLVDLAARQAVAEVQVGLHPCGMAFSPDRRNLYVAGANSDTICVIDTASRTVTATWDARPMSELPLGSAPNALAVAPDGRRLYAALGGNNCLAVFDTAGGRLLGLIPTGWYPGALALADGGRTIWIANVKGVGSRLYDQQKEPHPRDFMGLKDLVGYNSHDHMGSVTAVAAPGEEELADYTYRAAVNMRLPRMNQVLSLPAATPRVVPVPGRPGEISPIKHVIYIIKENRTYDQIFGDMTQGNGDPSLCHFPREVTPNHHALAEQFVLLDNFYCNGVLSADGHQWTDEGAVPDYLEKSFGGFTRSYPYWGDDAMAFPASGFIWDHVLRAGLTFRDYGEMVEAKITPAGATWSDIYRDFKDGTRRVAITARTPIRGLEPYIHPTFIGFPCKVQDVYRAQMFLEELAQFEQRGDMPNFIIMLLPNDHTVGTTPGYPTPRATVADNDLALGRIVDAVSRSRFWAETAIFVVQDDPQNGLDHVDGHRTVALCVSPYTRRGAVVSTHYNQCSMLRTIELIMGLAPISQFTMGANPMTDCFMDKPDLTPYQALPNIIPLDELNPPVAALKGQRRADALKSLALPLEDVDQADEDTLNRIIWHSVKGWNTPYPVLRQAVADENGEHDRD